MLALLLVVLLMGGCAAGGTDTPEPTAKAKDKDKEKKKDEPVSTLVTVNFAGTFGEDGTITGSFTYDNTSAPTAENVRGMAPNAVYPVTAWSITVNSGSLSHIMPSTVYTNTIASDTIEFCQGACQFANGPVIQLRFDNATGFRLQLVFATLDPTPFINPPFAVSEWGVMQQSEYGRPCPVCVPVAILHTGVVTGG